MEILIGDARVEPVVSHPLPIQPPGILLVHPINPAAHPVPAKAYSFYQKTVHKGL